MPIEQPVPKKQRDQYVAIEQDLFWIAENATGDELTAVGEIISMMRALMQMIQGTDKIEELFGYEFNKQLDACFGDSTVLGLKEFLNQRLNFKTRQTIAKDTYSMIWGDLLPKPEGYDEWLQSSDHTKLRPLRNSAMDASSKAESEPESPE